MARKDIVVVSILVIDDDAQVRTFLRIVLEAHGYEVREAGNGNDGVMVVGSPKTGPDVMLVSLA
jgi:DNA-binding response OmpR family regulator